MASPPPLSWRAASRFLPPFNTIAHRPHHHPKTQPKNLCEKGHLIFNILKEQPCSKLVSYLKPCLTITNTAKRYKNLLYT